MPRPPIHLLHVFPAFETGGAQVRTVVLMNALGGAYRHSVVAMNGDFSAAGRLDPSVEFQPVAFPRAGTAANARRFARLIADTRPDLLLTYNWGAIDAVMGDILAPVCPLVHVEDGFGPDEAARLKQRRLWARRLLLRRAAFMAVPSRTLERIAVERYWLPRDRVEFIPNGVDTARFAARSGVSMRSALHLPPDAFVVGTVGRLRPEKDLVNLVRRFKDAAIPRSWLVFVGDGPSRAEIEAAVKSCDLADRCLFTGEVADTSAVYSAFDLFAMTSITEQMPVGLLEAMSSGLPVLCTAVGDTASILEGSPSPQVLPGDQAEGYVELLRSLAADPDCRRENGVWNRERAVGAFSLNAMVRRWDHLYRQAAHVPAEPASQHQ